MQSSLWHFMRIQSQFINLVTVEVLPPYMPSQEEKQDPRLYADNVRRWGASTASSRRFLINLLSIVWPELTRLSYYGIVGHAHLRTSSQIALSSIGIKGAAPSDALGLHDRVATGQSVRSFAKPAPVQRREIKYVCNRLMAQRLGVPLVEQGLKQQQELKRRGICVDWTGR